METNTINQANELTCQQLVELITEFLEGAMGGATQTRFAAHLAMCPPCEVYVEQIRRTIELLARIDAGTPAVCNPPPELLDLFRSWREPEQGAED